MKILRLIYFLIFRGWRFEKDNGRLYLCKSFDDFNKLLEDSHG
jgi:hypothetical protein